MTPLAASLAKQRLLPLADRSFLDGAHLFDLLDIMQWDFHCFDVSEVWGLSNDMLDRMLDHERLAPGSFRSSFAKMGDKFSFLPAEYIWIETKIDGDGSRIGYLIGAKEKSDLATVFMVLYEKEEGLRSFILPFQIGMGAFGGNITDVQSSSEIIYTDPFVRKSAWNIQILLAMINTPKIIGRRQHMPNASLEKKMLRGRGGVKFPLHAWTEIKLNIAKPVEIDDGLPHEAHLSGSRALHFCRAHIRVKNGRIEFVTHHWRGNAAMGVRNTRYRVVSEPA